MVDFIPVVFNIILTVFRSNNPCLMIPFYFTAALGLYRLTFALMNRG